MPNPNFIHKAGGSSDDRLSRFGEHHRELRHLGFRVDGHLLRHRLYRLRGRVRLQLRLFHIHDAVGTNYGQVQTRLLRHRQLG